MATLSTDTYLGPYYLEKLVATGGMAEIYLARTAGIAGFEKHLVLKVIQPEMAADTQVVQMLVDEAKLTVHLNHPNIVQTFDLGKIEGITFLAMEYVDGLDFFQLLMRLSNMEDTIPIEAALHIIGQALKGLDYAHNKCDEQGNPLQIIHRDISPQNILLSRHGEVKIVDFGIARAANLSRRTRAGVIKGKLVYMSPEQAWGDTIDHRTDIFSAGIVLYEALTMGSLYLEQNPAKLLQQVRKASIKPPSHRRPEIPADLDELVMKALTHEPENRYQTAQEFAKAVSAYLCRIAPEYSEMYLSALVESVLEGKKPKPRTKAPTVLPAQDSMERKEYRHRKHSIIYPDAEPIPAPVAAGGATRRPVAELVKIGEEGEKPCIVSSLFVLGRAGDMELGDARVSRRHASISYRDGAYHLEDLGSSNGTFLNDTQVTKPCPLSNGDIIRIGPFELRFVLKEAPAEPEAGKTSTLTGGDGSVTLTMGEETLTIPVGNRLPLDHRIGVGEVEIGGPGAAVVHRSDGYWIEPAQGQISVLHNGNKVSTPTLLSNGDTIRVGPIEMSFSLTSPAET